MTRTDSGAQSHLGAFRIMLGTTVLSFGGFWLLLPVVPLWTAHGGAGAFGAGSSTAIFMLVTVLTQFTVPSLLRRVGHRWVLGMGMALLGAPGPALALSAHLAPVLGLSALRGVGFGLLTVCGSALVAELMPPREHSRASAQYGLATGLSQLVLLPVGLGLVERYGFPVVFLASAAPLLGVPLVPFLRARTSTGTPPPADSVRTPPTEPALAPASPPPVQPDDPLDVQAVGLRRGAVAPVLAMLGCAIAQSGLVTFLPLAFGGHGSGAGSGSVTVSVALFGVAVGWPLGRLVAGQLGDRRGLAGRLLTPGLLCSLLGMLAAVVATGLAGTAGVALLATGAVLGSFGFGLVQNDALVSLFVAAGPRRYGSASALWNIAYDAGTGAGAAGLGAVAEPFGFRAAFGAAALLLLLVAPITLVRGRRR